MTGRAWVDRCPGQVAALVLAKICCWHSVQVCGASMGRTKRAPITQACLFDALLDVDHVSSTTCQKGATMHGDKMCTTLDMQENLPCRGV